jgi:nucleotide-binding universal stress UspA family protein
MKIAAVLALASGNEDGEQTLKMAAGLAQSCDAGLDILHVRLDPRLSVPLVGEGMAAGMVEEIMERNERDAKDRAEAARRQAEAVASAHGQSLQSGEGQRGEGARAKGFSIAYQEVVGSEPEELRKVAPYHDLIVLDRPDLENDAYSTISVEGALMETGRALLLSPPGGIENLLGHIAIGWDGSKAATHAVAAALPLLAKAEKVTVMTIEERGKTGDAERLTAYLARHGIAATALHIPAEGIEAGYALLENAATNGAHCLVMGGYGHSRLREFIFGGATENVLRSAGIAVLMAH